MLFMLDVCCALIFHRGKLLAVQRGSGSAHPGQWEFPGGKIEPGETAVACIRREIAEELAVQPKLQAYLLLQEHDYGIKQIRLHPFVCVMKGIQLTLNEHENYCWLEPEELMALNWQEADRKLIQKNEDRILEWFRKNDDNGRK